MAPGDPLLEMRGLGADRGGVAVSGADGGVACRVSGRVRMESMIVSNEENDRPVAPGPTRKSVSPVNTVPSSGT